MTTGHLPFAMRLFICALVLIASGRSLAGETETPAQVQQLEKAILAARHSIKSGQFQVRRTYIEGKKSHKDEVFTYLDGLRVREDLKRGDVVDTKSFSDDYYYWHSNEKASNSGGYVLRMVALSKVNRRESQYYVHEPLRLMMHPLWYGAAYAYNPEYFVGSPLRSKFSAEQTTWAGEAAWKVSFQPEPTADSRIIYWVVPAQGYSITRMEYHWEDDNRIPHIDATEGSIRQVAPGIWFPSAVRYQRLVSGNLDRQEDLEISLTDVNVPVDPQIFTPARMNVPPNTLVARLPPDPRGEVKWDGKQIVPLLRNDHINLMGVRPTGDARLRKILFLFAALGFAAMGGRMIWKRYARKTQP